MELEVTNFFFLSVLVFPNLPCPINKKSSSGWKNGSVDSTSGWENFLSRECNATTPEDIYTCMAAKTYNREETVLETNIYRNGRLEDASNVIWKTELTTTWLGNCFRLDYIKPMGTTYAMDRANFVLNSNLSYWVFLHDPDYFFVNLNGNTFGKVFDILDGKLPCLLHKILKEKPPCKSNFLLDIVQRVELIPHPVLDTSEVNFAGKGLRKVFNDFFFN